MLITKNDDLKQIISIPENESDSDNSLFFLTIKEKDLFFVCFPIQEDENKFVCFSSEYDLLKSFNDNEIELSKTITAESSFFFLILEDEGINHLPNEFCTDIIGYDFNKSKLKEINYDDIKDDQCVIDMLDYYMESFY